MNRFLFLIIFMLCIGANDGISQPIASVVSYENDVITGVSLPDWGKVCIATEARGNPGENFKPLYSVPVGERVRIHDQSRPDGTWIAIAKARWIPLKSLCR